MENPARKHYLALLQVTKYLAAAAHDAIYYWRTEAKMDLFLHLSLLLIRIITISRMCSIHSFNFVAFADPDWGTDESYQQSITGMAIMLAYYVSGWSSWV